MEGLRVEKENHFAEIFNSGLKNQTKGFVLGHELWNVMYDEFSVALFIK